MSEQEKQETQQEMIHLRDLDTDELKKIGLSQVKVSASSDTKVSIAQFETMGVTAGMEFTFDVSAYTGTMPITEIFDQVAVPIRNSATRFAHADTIGRIQEMRAIIEGIRDGKTFQEIEKEVHSARQNTLRLMRASFERR